MRRLWLLAVVLVVAAPAASAPNCGLRGTIKEPRAVCPQDEDCNGPAAGVTIVFTRSNGAVKRVTSNAYGRYRVALQPGTYDVSSPAARGTRGRVMPPSVRVYAGRYRQITFLVYSGIRPQ